MTGRAGQSGHPILTSLSGIRDMFEIGGFRPGGTFLILASDDIVAIVVTRCKSKANRREDECSQVGSLALSLALTFSLLIDLQQGLVITLR
jgi:hypothetical protein